MTPSEIRPNESKSNFRVVGTKKTNFYDSITCHIIVRVWIRYFLPRDVSESSLRVLSGSPVRLAGSTIEISLFLTKLCIYVTFFQWLYVCINSKGICRINESLTMLFLLTYLCDIYQITDKPNIIDILRSMHSRKNMQWSIKD